MEDTGARSVTIEIVRAEDRDFAVVQNLFPLYVHDLSEFTGWDVPDTGLFVASHLLLQYWGKKPRDARFHWPDGLRGFPFLIREDGKLAGFVLIREIAKEPPGFDVGEFFVLRKFRGRGVGKGVAHRVFDMFPGNWQVRELEENTPAQAFWRRVIGDYTGGDYMETREVFPPFPNEMIVQRFSNAGKGEHRPG
jgi:predicted acetyltransferase